MNLSNATYLTSEGQARLKKELEELKTTGRLELSARLRSAIQMGDLSENADYIKAKEDQGFLEGRIIDLENTLRNAIIIDNIKKDTSIVSIGDTITLELDGDEAETYYLVGPKEADPINYRISYESPIGKAVLGFRPGDIVEAETPTGKIQIKIVEIK
ncbi:MAG: transcription elongation factor GreA [Anaerolineaceae bacterium]|nr:transcription elongation factor GreA [Anaerolineaceae bacterium]